MVRKKKARSLSNRGDQADAGDENDRKPVMHREGTLAEKLAEKNIEFDSTVEDIRRLLKDETILKDADVRYFLLRECLVLALFSTVSGPSLLDGDFQIAEEPPLPMWSARMLRRQWEVSDYIFLKFLSFVMENENFCFQIDDFKSPAFKTRLWFLTSKIVDDSSIVLDENYNALYDYIRTIKSSQLEDWLAVTLTIDGGPDSLRKIICSYNREFEAVHNCCYYSLIEQEDSARKFKLQLFQRVLPNPSGSDHQTLAKQFKKLFEPDFFPEDSVSESGVDHQQISHDENIFSFDINHDGTLAVPNLISHIPIRHDLLSKTLGLHKHNSPLLIAQFKVICGLVDPLTQPLPNDQHVISIDFLHKVFLGYMYQEIMTACRSDEGFDWKFHIAFNMQKILKCSMIRLNSDSFEKLNSINNSDESVDWRKQLNVWLPHGFNPQNLELIYMINILAVYTIYKMYCHLPIQMNPFLSTLISLWKNLTCVILLGLEIDRFEEEHETFDTPVLVRATIRGATALRAVLADIINGHVEYHKHDFEHESLNAFMSPYGRKLCQGALFADLKSHAGAILALGIDLEDVTALLADLQAGDRFDEDVRYMFEYEYDDFHDLQQGDLSPEYDDALEDEAENTKTVRQRRCHCIFDDDEMEHEEDREAPNEVAHGELKSSKDQYEPHISLLSNGKPQAVRQPNSFEFDYSGKDWRDIPRGKNFYYSEKYDFIEKPDLELIISLTLKATSLKLNETESSVLLRSIASCVKNEHDEAILGNFLELSQSAICAKQSSDDEGPHFHNVQPDDIYELWCLDSTFEKMVQRNPHVSWRLMDEMLVCSGYRRVLIWFITHMKLNFTLIEYIYELVMRLRGDPSSDEHLSDDPQLHPNTQPGEPKKGDKTNLPFSRQGSIELSVIETKMLMQEFFTNAAISLSERPKEQNGESAEEEDPEISLYDVELMKLICSMVRAFIIEEKFDFSETESAFELQALLMNWMAIVPEARSLFFDLKSIISGLHMKRDKDSNEEHMSGKWDVSTHQKDALDSNEDFEPNRKLMSLLPLPLKGSEDSVETVALQTLRDFIKKYPFTSHISTIGRKVVYQDNEILPLAKSDQSLSLHDYLLEFGEEYDHEDDSDSLAECF